MFPFPKNLFLLTTLATLALLGPELFTSPVGHGSPASFTLYGSAAAGWGPASGTETSPGPPLTVAPGERVTLLLNSDDGSPHDWGVDYNNNEISDGGEPKSPVFTTGTSFPFDATSTSGTYQYYCFIHKGLMVGSFIVQAAEPDFAIDANPPTVGPLNIDALGASTITVDSLNGFTGTVGLTTSPSAGLTASTNPTSISGGSGTSTLTVSSATAGTYAVTVTGTSGTLSHSVDVTVNVAAPDFALGANPTTVGPLNLGAQGTSTISITALNGFSDTVDLTATPSSGLTASVSPPSISGGSGSSTLTVSAASAGSYSVTVTGTSGSLSHVVDLTVNVVGPDFSLSATPSLSVNQGLSGNFTVSLQSVRGFSGSVALTVTVSPAGPSVSASPATVTLADGGVGSVVVTVSAVGGVYSSVAAGVYSVRVTGTGGSVSHFVDVGVTVGSSGGSGLGSVPLTYLVGGVVGVVGLVGVAVFLVRRGNRKKTGDMV